MPHLTLLPSAPTPKPQEPAGMGFDLAETLDLVFDDRARAELERRLEAVRRRRKFRLIQGGACADSSSTQDEDAAV